MSSYRGAWDGGPPGAEGEYGEPPIPGAGPPAAAHPTDPWTGVSYGHYAPGLDYAAYGGYAYGYDPSGYYRRPDGSYYAPAAGHCATPAPAAAPPPPPPPGLEYSRRPRTPSPRSSPPRRYRERSASYSRRDDEPRRRRERSRDRRNKYSSSERSLSRSPRALKRSRRRKSSSNSSTSDRSFQRKAGRSRRGDRSPTPSSRRSPHRRSVSKSPRFESDRSVSGGDQKYHSGRDDSKGKDRKRVVITPPRKKRDSVTPPPKARKDRSVTPPRTYKKDRDRSLTPPKSYKYKSDTPPRKARNSSITPPKSYARSGSVSSDKSDKSGSKSSDKSPPPPRRKKRSPRRSPSASSSDSASSGSSRERSKAKRKESKRRSKSRSRSRSNRRSRSKSESKSRRRSRSKEGRKKRSVSPRSVVLTKDDKARSPGGTPSDDEQRRGQFTVADRKRFWKMHKYRQEKDPKTPPKEIKPPPGAVESTTVDDVEYGVPPDLEGPNFAELLPPPDLALLAQASSSKSKPVVPVIKNDGSFLEMFKKMQEATKKAEEAVKPVIKKPTLPFIGKRRGGRVLKTGVVKKAKAIDEQTVDNAPKDAWSLYMQEVKKYRETSCEEERKTRPLVK